MRYSLRIVPLLLLVWSMTACGMAGATGPAVVQSVGKPGAPKVEIVYLNHPPVRYVMGDVDKVLEVYGDNISVTRYRFETPEGDAFARSKGITEHTPIVIFINGSMDAVINGQPIKFYNFPGTSWKVEDLRASLDLVTKQK